MNTLKRRMFQNGDEVNTSLSPAILTYIEKLGIKPKGKTAAELQAEIQKELSLQDAENAPGLFRTYAFDYKDPLDYVAAGLTATGIAAGAGIYLKTANTARKVKKIKDAARRAAKALNPVVRKGGINVPGQIGFQARNRFDPRSYIYKPTQTAIYGTGLGVGAKMMGDDSISTSLMPDNITSELAKLAENEKTEQQRKLDLNAEKAAKEKEKEDKELINQTLGILKTKGEIFDKEENKRVFEERKYNANTLMQEIGSAMAKTGSIDDGLALGATAAAKRISEEKLAQKLAEGELNKKMLEDSKLKETTVLKIIEDYGEQAGSGGNVTYYTGSVAMSANQQIYDLSDAASVTLESGTAGVDQIEVKRIFHEAPPAIVKYFDPFVGTGLGSQNMLEGFGWGQYSPGVSFMMMPMNADLLRMQAIEFNDQIRKSAYTFELVNDRIKFFPIPNGSNFTKVYFEYIKKADRSDPLKGDVNTVSDFSNIPYEDITYTYINAVGKQWIRRYTLALCKEMLGYIRGKYSSLPIPNAEVTLNGSDLISAGATEKEGLITELKEVLDTMSRQSQLERKQAEADSLQQQMNKIPLKIYIG